MIYDITALLLCLFGFAVGVFLTVGSIAANGWAGLPLTCLGVVALIFAGGMGAETWRTRSWRRRY